MATSSAMVMLKARSRAPVPRTGFICTPNQAQTLTEGRIVYEKTGATRNAPVQPLPSGAQQVCAAIAL